VDKDDVTHRWDDVLAKLKQERDELALKMHLGKKEAAAEWERLEAKWHEVKAKKMSPVKDAACTNYVPHVWFAAIDGFPTLADVLSRKDHKHDNGDKD
jgi:hypothetical protein